jgi:hypothetical protein
MNNDMETLNQKLNESPSSDSLKETLEQIMNTAIEDSKEGLENDSAND